MNYDFNPIRYDIIRDKNPREILMLRGRGCAWRRCTFCDYHMDYSRDEQANYQLNLPEIAKVTGLYHRLEVINSGSFNELDEQTIEEIFHKCHDRAITDLHVEMHWLHREAIRSLRQRCADAGLRLHVKMGVETFDAQYRDEVLKKGMAHATPEEIQPYADDVCLLFGLTGQTVDSMKHDVEIGLSYFHRVCINIMVENTTKLRPDPDVIRDFQQEIYPLYIDNPRIDILMNNTDFGVGGEKDYDK